MLVDAQKIDRFTPARAPSEGWDEARARVLVRRARVLPPKEKLLVEMALQNRMSHRQMGVALGRPAGTVTRQLKRLLRRLNDPLVVALLDDACPLPADVRWPALHRLLGVVSVASLTAEFEITRPVLRQRVNYARGWYQGLTARVKPKPPRWEAALSRVHG